MRTEAQYRIAEAFDRTDREYLRSIECRKRGSTWIGGRIPWQVLAALAWEPLAMAGFVENVCLPEYSYFQFDSPLPIGLQRIKLLHECTEEEMRAIEIVGCKHGNKKLILRHDGAIETQLATLIIKLDRDRKDTVATCHPGILTATLEAIPAFDGSIDSLKAVRNSGLPIAVNFY